MAIAGTNKTTGSANNPTSGQVTASIAFANDTLYLFSIVNRGATADATSLSGGGLTWTRKSSYPGRELWEGFTASGATTGTIAMTWTGTSTGLWWVIDEFTGIDITTRLVQTPAGATGTATSGSVTLAAFGDSVNNVSFAFFTHVVNETSTVEAGYTALGNFGAALTPDAGLLTEWKIGEDLAVTASWTTSSVWHGLAAEIKAATSTTTTVDVTTPGATTFAGQASPLVENISAVAGALTLAGQAMALVTSIGAVAGSVTLTGSSVTLVVAVSVGAGAVTFAGQTVTANTITTVSVTTPGAVALAGQVVGLKVSITAGAGAATWAGQAVGLKSSVVVSAGALTMAGQAVGLNLLLSLASGASTWAGQSVTAAPPSGASVLILVSTPGKAWFTGRSVTVWGIKSAPRTLLTGAPTKAAHSATAAPGASAATARGASK